MEVTNFRHDQVDTSNFFAHASGLSPRAARPPAYAGETIDHMKNRDANRHPGIMRVMKVDSEFAGILVAVGFLVMGAVGLDIGRWFVLGAVGLGVAVALLLRLTRKNC